MEKKIKLIGLLCLKIRNVNYISNYIVKETFAYHNNIALQNIFNKKFYADDDVNLESLHTSL